MIETGGDEVKFSMNNRIVLYYQNVVYTVLMKVVIIQIQKS